MKKLIILLLCAIVVGIFFWYKNSREPDVVKINYLAHADSAEVLRIVKDIYDAGHSGDEKTLRSMMIAVDGMGFRDYCTFLKELEAPDFSTARIGSPVVNPDVFYVFVNSDSKRISQFTLRKTGGKLLFSGVNWSIK